MSQWHFVIITSNEVVSCCLSCINSIDMMLSLTSHDATIIFFFRSTNNNSPNWKKCTDGWLLTLISNNYSWLITLWVNPMDMMLFYCNVTSQHEVYTPGWRKALWELSVLSNNTLGTHLEHTWTQPALSGGEHINHHAIMSPNSRVKKVDCG